MRAIVERNAAVATDAYGGAVAPSWQPHLTVPCYAWHASAPRGLVADGAKTAFMQELLCAFPRATDVTERDRVARIEDRRAAVLFAGPYAILAPLRRRPGHLEATLERVQ